MPRPPNPRPTAGRTPAPTRPGQEKPRAEFFVTTVRITRDDWRWLHTEALERAAAGGRGTDASAVLREVLAAARARASGRKSPRRPQGGRS